MCELEGCYSLACEIVREMENVPEFGPSEVLTLLVEVGSQLYLIMLDYTELWGKWFCNKNWTVIITSMFDTRLSKLSKNLNST